MRKNDNQKPRRVKAKIIRLVTEIAIVDLDRDGGIEEIVDICDELDSDDEHIVTVISVISIQ